MIYRGEMENKLRSKLGSVGKTLAAVGGNWKLGREGWGSACTSRVGSLLIGRGSWCRAKHFDPVPSHRHRLLTQRRSGLIDVSTACRGFFSFLFPWSSPSLARVGRRVTSDWLLIFDLARTNAMDARSSSRPRPASRPTTPLRPSSRSSIRNSYSYGSSVNAAGYEEPAINALEPQFAELADSMADLEANFMHLQLMHESLSRFSESFASFLYGLNMNAFCVDFPEVATRSFPQLWYMTC